MEADTLSHLCHQDNILLIVGGLDFDQLVVFPKIDGLQAGLADILVLHNGGLLYHSIFGGHEQIPALLIFPDGNNGRHLFARKKL